MDKVSIIVPIYNTKREYLIKCVDSIINQTYKNIEIILMDDGSKDETRELCDELAQKDTRISVVHKKNEGVSEARNAGIKYSTGKWLAFVDSDDWIEPEAIEIQVVQAKNSEVVIGNLCIDDERNTAQHEYRKVVLNINNELINNLLLDKPSIVTLGSVCAKLYLKSVIVNNEIKFTPKVKIGEDYLFNFEVFFYAKRVLYISEYIYHYRNDNLDSITRTYDDKIVEKYTLLIDEFKEKIKKLNVENIGSVFYIFVIRQLIHIFYMNLYANKNNLSGHDRQEIIEKLSEMEPFKEAVKKVDIRLLMRRKKITVLLLRLKLFKLIDWLWTRRSK